MGKGYKASDDVLTASGKESAMRDIFPDPTVLETVLIEKGKGKNKVVNSITQKVKEAVRLFCVNALQEKSAKDQKEQAAKILRKYTEKIRTEEAKAGDYQQTYRVNGPEETSGNIYAASVSQQNRFSFPKDDREMGTLRQAVGDAFIDAHFEKDIVISIREDVLENKAKRRELSEKLVKLFGAEGLRDWFEKEEVWSAKDTLAKAQYELADDARAKLQEITPQYSDAVKDVTYDPKP